MLSSGEEKSLKNDRGINHRECMHVRKTSQILSSVQLFVTGVVQCHLVTKCVLLYRQLKYSKLSIN